MKKKKICPKSEEIWAGLKEVVYYYILDIIQETHHPYKRLINYIELNNKNEVHTQTQSEFIKDKFKITDKKLYNDLNYLYKMYELEPKIGEFWQDKNETYASRAYEITGFKKDTQTVEYKTYDMFCYFNCELPLSQFIKRYEKTKSQLKINDTWYSRKSGKPFIILSIFDNPETNDKEKEKYIVYRALNKKSVFVNTKDEFLNIILPIKLGSFWTLDGSFWDKVGHAIKNEDYKSKETVQKNNKQCPQNSKENQLELPKVGETWQDKKTKTLMRILKVTCHEGQNPDNTCIVYIKEDDVDFMMRSCAKPLTFSDVWSDFKKIHQKYKKAEKENKRCSQDSEGNKLELPKVGEIWQNIFDDMQCTIFNVNNIGIITYEDKSGVHKIGIRSFLRLFKRCKNIIKDNNQQYPQDSEKNEYRYISNNWLDSIAYGLTSGANKHPGETWRDIPAKEHAARALRHLNLYLVGDKKDNHLINASMRCMMAFETDKERIYNEEDPHKENTIAG